MSKPTPEGVNLEGFGFAAILLASVICIALTFHHVIRKQSAAIILPVPTLQASAH